MRSIRRRGRIWSFVLSRIPPAVHRSHLLIALLAPMLLAAGCGGSSTATHTGMSAPAATAPVATQPAATAHEYPAAVQRTLLAGCMHGGTQSQCTCVLKKLEASYTLTQMQAIERAMKANVAPPAGFTKIAAECNG
jgi:hypothetical protein